MEITEAFRKLVEEHNKVVKHVDELTDCVNKLTERLERQESINNLAHSPVGNIYKLHVRMKQIEEVMIINGGTISDLIDASIDDKLMDIRTTMALEQELNK